MESETTLLHPFSCTVAYNDLSDVWDAFGQDLKDALPLKNVSLISKMGVKTMVDSIPVSLVPSQCPDVVGLENHRKCSLSWFRLPFVNLVCFSCEDYEEYKRNFRLQLRAMVDPETRLATDPMPVFVYVRPSNIEDDNKGPVRVLDTARRELVEKGGLERVVGYFSKESGLNGILSAIKSAISAMIEARRLEYQNETSRIIVRLIRDSTAPVKSDMLFSDLFLVKDSVAVMLETVGLYQDALTEYTEVDVMIEETYNRIRGESTEEEDNGDDRSLIECISSNELVPECSQLWLGWNATRSIITQSANPVGKTTKEGRIFIDSVLKPAIVSNQVRLLLKAGKLKNAVEKVATFVDTFSVVIKAWEQTGRCSHGVYSSWMFSIYASLISLLSNTSGSMSRLDSDEKIRRVGLQKNGPVVEEEVDVWLLTSPEFPDNGRLLNNECDPRDRNALAWKLGEIALRARQSLEILGSRKGLNAPEFKPTVHEILSLLTKEDAAAKTPTPQSVPIARKVSTEVKLTPQPSIDPEDVRQTVLHMNGNEEGERHNYQEEKMDMIDLKPGSQDGDSHNGSRTATEGKGSQGSNAEKKPSLPPKISVHSKDISDADSSISTPIREMSELSDLNLSPSASSQRDMDVPKVQPLVPNISLVKIEGQIANFVAKENNEPNEAFYFVPQAKSEGIEKIERIWQPRDWRLRSGLKDIYKFRSLWRVLTQVSHSYFISGGWERSACLCSLDIADLCYLEGQTDEAHAMYLHVCRQMLKQTWFPAISQYLCRLGCSQVLLSDSGVVWTSFYLLKNTQELCRKSPKFARFSPSECFQALESAASKFGTLFQNSWYDSFEKCLDFSSFLAISPFEGPPPRLYDQQATDSDKWMKAGTTHSIACVGDVVKLKVRIHNKGSFDVLLSDIKLSLIGVQELNDIASRDAIAKSPFRKSLNLVGTPMAATSISQSPGWHSPSKAKNTSAPQVISHWRELDELEGVCSQVHEESGCATLSHGDQVFEFVLSPTKSGYYKLGKLSALFHGIPVEVPIKASEIESKCHKLVLEVKPALPRIQLLPLGVGEDCLIAGEVQWLGIHILHKEWLYDAKMMISWPVRHKIYSGSYTGSNAELNAFHESGMHEASYNVYPYYAPVLVSSLNTSIRKRILCPDLSQSILPTDPGTLLYSVPNSHSNDALTVWWKVGIEQHKPSHEEVRIIPRNSKVLYSQDLIGSPTKKSREPSGLGKASLFSSELPIAMQYHDFCNRSISTSVTLPIKEPFTIHTTAHEISSLEIIVTARIRSTTSRNLQLKNINLKCQQGFYLVRNILKEMDLLPFTLGPFSSFSSSFVVSLEKSLGQGSRAISQAMIYRNGKIAPSIISLEYLVLGEESPGEVLCLNGSQHFAHSTTSVSWSSDQPEGPSADDAATVSSRHSMLTPSEDEADIDDFSRMFQHDGSNELPCHAVIQMRHTISFQLSSSSETGSSAVFVSVRMIGPFSTVIGCPVTFCWRLERIGSSELSNDPLDATIAFEVIADRSCWNPLGRTTGRIQLGHKSGSLAVLEAAWVAIMPGTLEPPILKLQDAFSQEASDVGAMNNLIVVRPA
eukprot:jgi/Picsp_1/1936/NSC_05402-R1_trafficking protein particle complex subunit 10